MSGWRDDPSRGQEEPYPPQYAPEHYAPGPAPAEYDDDNYAYDDDRERRRRPVTPFRVVIALAFIASVAVTLYALFVERTAVQVPILVSGLAVLGITLVIMAFGGAAGATRSAEAGRGGRAFWSALLGGLCALGAAGALGSAVVFALIWVSAR